MTDPNVVWAFAFVLAIFAAAALGQRLNQQMPTLRDSERRLRAAKIETEIRRLEIEANPS